VDDNFGCPVDSVYWLYLLEVRSVKCCCGHAESHHNPGDPYMGMQDDFSGNCRNCKCPEFTNELKSVRDMSMDQLIRVGLIPSESPLGSARGLIARQRGEYIVRKWQDEVEALKVEHENELARRDVMLEEQKRFMRIANKKLVELENEIKELKKSTTGEHSALCQRRVGFSLECDCGLEENATGGHDKSCPARMGSTCDCGKL